MTQSPTDDDHIRVHRAIHTGDERHGTYRGLITRLTFVLNGCTVSNELWGTQTFLIHPHHETLLQPTRLALIAMRLVDCALAGGRLASATHIYSSLV